MRHYLREDTQNSTNRRRNQRWEIYDYLPSTWGRHRLLVVQKPETIDKGLVVLVGVNSWSSTLLPQPQPPGPFLFRLFQPSSFGSSRNPRSGTSHRTSLPPPVSPQRELSSLPRGSSVTCPPTHSNRQGGGVGLSGSKPKVLCFLNSVKDLGLKLSTLQRHTLVRMVLGITVPL